MKIRFSVFSILFGVLFFTACSDDLGQLETNDNQNLEIDARHATTTGTTSTDCCDVHMSAVLATEVPSDPPAGCCLWMVRITNFADCDISIVNSLGESYTQPQGAYSYPVLFCDDGDTSNDLVTFQIINGDNQVFKICDSLSFVPYCP